MNYVMVPDRNSKTCRVILFLKNFTLGCISHTTTHRYLSYPIPLTITKTRSSKLQQQNPPVPDRGVVSATGPQQGHFYVSNSTPIIGRVSCADNAAWDADVDDDESSNAGRSDGQPLSPSAMATLVQVSSVWRYKYLLPILFFPRLI